MKTNQEGTRECNELEIARGLLREALKHINKKPWDEPTLLHARISEFLGVPVEYADFVEAVRREE